MRQMIVGFFFINYEIQILQYLVLKEDCMNLLYLHNEELHFILISFDPNRKDKLLYKLFLHK